MNQPVYYPRLVVPRWSKSSPHKFISGKSFAELSVEHAEDVISQSMQQRRVLATCSQHTLASGSSKTGADTSLTSWLGECIRRYHTVSHRRFSTSFKIRVLVSCHKFVYTVRMISYPRLFVASRWSKSSQPKLDYQVGVFAEFCKSDKQTWYDISEPFSSLRLGHYSYL